MPVRLFFAPSHTPPLHICFFLIRAMNNPLVSPKHGSKSKVPGRLPQQQGSCRGPALIAGLGLDAARAGGVADDFPSSLSSSAVLVVVLMLA